MNIRKLLSGSTVLACAVAPALALAAPSIPPAPRILHVTSVGRVDVGALANTPINLAVRNALSGRVTEMRRHPYPNLIGADLLAQAPVVTTPNVTVKAGAGGKSGGFVGIYGGSNAAAFGSDLEPPDQGLAVNNGMVAEVVNDSFQVFDSTGAPLRNPVSLYSFMAVDSSAGLGDPHVEYDASTQRWFVSGYLQTGSFNGFALAVSVSNNPLGVYSVYQVDAGTANIPACAGSCFPDYPQVGYDANGFYIAADLFSNVTGGFVAAAVYALPKAALITGQPLNYGYFLLNDFVVEPSIPAVPGGYDSSAGGTEYLMTARSIYNGSATLRVYAISNTSAIGSLGEVANMIDLKAEPYGPTVPSTQPDEIGPRGQSQGATSAPSLDGGYHSFGSGVKYLNGALYGALATASKDGNGLPRDVIAWFKVAVSSAPHSVTASIGGQGYIVPPNGYSITYPGWALDGNANGIIGTTVTNPNPNVVGGYPSAGFVRVTNGVPGRFYVVTGQGAASDDGFTGYSGPGPAGVGRWGDFSSATVDPVTGLFYVGNEFIPNAAVYPRTRYENWGTFITEAK